MISDEMEQKAQTAEQSAMAGSLEGVRPLLIERFVPYADIVETHELVVNTTPEATYAALRSVDFAKFPYPLMRVRIFLRVLAVEIARYRLGMRPLRKPVRLTLEDVAEFGQMKLAEIPGVEIVIGAIARPFDLKSIFEQRAPGEFEPFRCPGYIKAAASFHVAPYGAHRSLLSYEVRIRATDTATRRRLFFWSNLFAPTISRSIRRAVEFVKDTVERRCGAERRGYQAM
jgi:hypothetical protein